jgi:hypothetical protein
MKIKIKFKKLLLIQIFGNPQLGDHVLGPMIAQLLLLQVK